MAEDIFYMRRVLKLAEKGFPYTFPNPLVGAVLVKNKRIIAEGYHRRVGFPHAEIEALNNCKESPRGSTLYVNLEPCVHFGRTPPCVERIAKEGIRRVIISSLDANPKVRKKGISFLKSKGIEVRIGLLKEEAKRLNEVYFTAMSKRRPFTVLKIAQTLDGKIATSKGESKWITSLLARKFHKKERNLYQGILVGINTVIKDDPSLSSSGPPYPRKIVLDTYLRIKKSLKIFKTPGEVWIFTSQKNRKVQGKIKKARLFFVREREGYLNLDDILKILFKEGIYYLLVEGGSRVFGSFFDRKAVDKIIFYLAPLIMGSKSALNSIDARTERDLGHLPFLRDFKIDTVGRDLRIEGYVQFR